jgi:hypothetical protein
MTHCAEFLRSMAEADDPGHPCELDLCASVGDVVNDFIPVFQHAGHKLVFHAGTPVKVVADPDKLARALFLLIDGYAVQECDLSVQVRAPGVLQFRRGTYHEHGSERVRQSIALAQRMLSATQAKIHTVDHGAEQRMIVRWDTSARSNRRCGL